MVMPHRGGGWRGSRDYALPVICCAVQECPANNQRGKCSMPSLINILPSGKCEKGVQAREAVKKEKGEKP